MKIIIADDHAVVRKGLSQVLSDIGDVTSVDEVSNGQELLEKVSATDCDAVVLDISMPGKSGLDVLKDLKQLKPEIPVLVLSIYPENQYAERVLKAGASGYLTKDSAPEELANAVKKVLGGRKYISPSLAEKLASGLMGDSDKLLHEQLSDREFEVFKMIASGRAMTDIAKDLFLSVKTVSTYKARIYDKMNLKSREDITQYALKNDLVD